MKPATAARELTRFGRIAALHATMFDKLDDDTVMSAISEVADHVEAELELVRCCDDWLNPPGRMPSPSHLG